MVSRYSSARIAGIIEQRWDDVEAVLGALDDCCTRGTPTPRGGCRRNAATSAGRDDVGRVLLDSTVLIDALRGRPAAERVRQMRRVGDEPWVCAISVEEIRRGARPEEQPTVRRLFRGLRCAPLGVAEANERADGVGSWLSRV